MIGVGTFSFNQKIVDNVLEVIKSNRISYGPKCKELEQRLALIHGNSYGVVSNSGTDSLRIALQAMKILYGWEDGDEVIVPAVTFVATVNVVLQNNLKPVLVDVKRGTWNIDTELIEDAMTDRTRCIMPVSLFGNPCNLRKVGLATELGRNPIRVIHDACEAMFSRHKHHELGVWADITCFSLYVAHHVVSGVGGCATTDNDDLSRKMRQLVNHGRDASYTTLEDRSLDNIEDRFKFEHIGHSSRMTELQAAIALAQLDNYEAMLYQRRMNAEKLKDMLKGLPISALEVHPQDDCSWMMFPVNVHTRYFKYDLMKHLENNGVETRECLPLVNQQCYKGLWNPDDYPVAQSLDQSSFYVGIHQDLSHIDLLKISDAFHSYFEG